MVCDVAATSFAHLSLSPHQRLGVHGRIPPPAKQRSDPHNATSPVPRTFLFGFGWPRSITIKKSIFTPRRKEAESRTFWDTERVVRKALDTDFGRMLKEDRMVKLMAKSDSAVVQGKKTVVESLEEVRICSVGRGTDAVR